MPSIVYKATVTLKNGKTETYNLQVAGGLLTAEQVAEHLNKHGHFDKQKPTAIEIDPEPIGVSEDGAATMANNILGGKPVNVHRVAKVAPRPDAPQVEGDESTPENAAPISGEGAVFPPTQNVAVDEAVTAPVARVAEQSTP